MNLNSNSRPKVLIAPLDWGLGHATRCVPLIRLLLNKGCQVLIAANGPQKILLLEEFPGIQFVDLDGYKIRYSRKMLMLGLMMQLFKIREAITREHKNLAAIISEHQIDWVISDNRYGLYSNSIPTTFITHQLNVMLPRGLTWGRFIIRNYLYSLINKHTNCWVPDLPDISRGLSGELGHPKVKPAVPTFYTGWLSRFVNDSPGSSTLYKCIIILSGPEPQRSILEEILFNQLKKQKEAIVVVRGLPEEQSIPGLPPNITIFNHLAAHLLKQYILQSEFLVSRSGYSTLMDAFALQKKCIFIPTPGQTEQEYLGKIIRQKQMALVYQQNNFCLKTALNTASKFTFHFPLNTMNDLLEIAVENMLTGFFSKTPGISFISTN